MPHTYLEVRNRLSSDEPNYRALAEMGGSILPYLEAIVSGDDAMLASKAAYLAGIIDSTEKYGVLVVAAGSSSHLVRSAVASAMRHTDPDESATLARELMRDPHQDVRIAVLKALSPEMVTRLGDDLKSIIQKDRSRTVRALAQRRIDD